ncbi:MAG: hypothetical protein ACP5J5_04655 [Dissulfurimicrobium sp.]
MKKLNLLIAVLVSVSLMGGLVACSKSEEKKEGTTTEQAAPAPKVEEAAPATEQAAPAATPKEEAKPAAPATEQAAPAATPEAPKTK